MVRFAQPSSELELSSQICDYIKKVFPNVIDKSDRLVFRCPYCGDSKKSDTLARGNYYKRSGIYKCYNGQCSKATTGLKLISDFSGISYKDLKHELVKFTLGGKSPHVKRPIDPNEVDILKVNNTSKIQYRIENMLDEVPDHIKVKLDQRLLFSAPRNNIQFKWLKEKEWLVVPWKYQDKYIYYQYRNYSTALNEEAPKYIFPKYYKRLFWGLDQLNTNMKYLFLTEGVFNAVFVYNGVACGSINLSDVQYNLLKTNFKDYKLVFMFDNHFVDKASRKKLPEFMENYPNDLFFIFPEQYRKYKDINDVCIGEKDPFIFNNINMLLKHSYTPLKIKMLKLI